MAQPITIPTNAYIIPVNLSSSWKTFTLPVVSTNAGRMIIFKDMFGNAANSTIRLSTIGLDRIERSNVSSIALSNAFGAWTFLNDGFTNWFLMDAYRNNLFQVSRIPNVLRITFAWYGPTYNVSGANVTTIVQNSFNSGATSIGANNSTFGDPTPGTYKFLFVDYVPPGGTTSNRSQTGEGGTLFYNTLT